MTIQTQPLDIDDFSGGMTDNYVDGDLRKFKTGDNLVLVPVGSGKAKLVSRPGSTLFDSTYYQVPAGVSRISKLINFKDEKLLIQNARKIHWIDGGWQTLTGPSGNDVFPAGTTSSIVSAAEWNNHFLVTNSEAGSVMKIYKDSGGTLRVRNAGLPKLASNPTVTAGAVGSNTYLYKFVYFYEYNVEGITFQDFGAPTTAITLSNAEAPNTSAVSIASIPVISNGTTENYDTAVIKVKIYRTVNAGTTYYYVGEVTNGTTTFSDSVSDATLQTNTTLYTTGGVVENDPAPKAKIVHVVEDVAIYGAYYEGSELIKNAARFSVPGDIDASPEDFYVEFDSELIAVSSVGKTPIFLCKKGLYRTDGFFDLQGRGGPVREKISDKVGCVSSLSVVQTQKGIFFAGTDGFYFTNGYDVLKVSEGLEDSYAALVSDSTQAALIEGVLDPENKYIIWSVQEDSSSADNDTFWMMDLRWGIKSDMPFTTWSGGAAFSPSAITFYQGNLIRGDHRGYVLKHLDTLLTDPKIDQIKAPSQWASQTIVYDYESCAINFGSNFTRKWVPRIVVSAKNKSNLSLQIKSNNDDHKKIAELTPIRFRGNLTWGDTDLVWGDADLIWDYDGIIEEQRRFPARSLRAAYKQIQLTNAYVIVQNSDTIGTATCVNASKTVTLDTAGSIWTDKAVGYYIYFSNDSYTRGYEISARTATELTVLDPLDLLPDASLAWVIKGYPKDEQLYLLGYTLHFAPLSKTQLMFKGETGANAS